MFQHERNQLNLHARQKIFFNKYKFSFDPQFHTEMKINVLKVVIA